MRNKIKNKESASHIESSMKSTTLTCTLRTKESASHILSHHKHNKDLGNIKSRGRAYQFS